MKKLITLIILITFCSLNTLTLSNNSLKTFKIYILQSDSSLPEVTYLGDIFRAQRENRLTLISYLRLESQTTINYDPNYLRKHCLDAKHLDQRVSLVIFDDSFFDDYSGKILAMDNTNAPVNTVVLYPELTGANLIVNSENYLPYLLF